MGKPMQRKTSSNFLRTRDPAVMWVRRVEATDSRRRICARLQEGTAKVSARMIRAPVAAY